MFLDGMNFSDPFIRRPIGTSLLAFGLLLFGCVAYRFLPVAPLPRVEFPMVSVSASLPGEIRARWLRRLQRR